MSLMGISAGKAAGAQMKKKPAGEAAGGAVAGGKAKIGAALGKYMKKRKMPIPGGGY